MLSWETLIKVWKFNPTTGIGLVDRPKEIFVWTALKETAPDSDAKLSPSPRCQCLCELFQMKVIENKIVSAMETEGQFSALSLNNESPLSFACCYTVCYYFGDDSVMTDTIQNIICVKWLLKDLACSIVSSTITTVKIINREEIADWFKLLASGSE